MRYVKKQGVFMCDVKHLDKEIIKCQKEKEKILNDLPIYEKIYLKSKREYDAKVNRIRTIDDFIFSANGMLKKDVENEENKKE